MPKRTFWFTAGASAGFGGAMWVRRQVLRTVQRYTPEQVQADLADSVRRLGTDLRAAVTEGRSTMADREAELRSELRPGAGTAAAGAEAPAPGGLAVAGPAAGAAHAADPGGAPPARRARTGRRAGRSRSRHAHLS